MHYRTLPRFHEHYVACRHLRSPSLQSSAAHPPINLGARQCRRNPSKHFVIFTKHRNLFCCSANKLVSRPMLNPVRCERCTQITKCKLISQALVVVVALRWRQNTIDWPWPPKTYVSMWVLLIIACSSCSRFTLMTRANSFTHSRSHISHMRLVHEYGLIATQLASGL